METISNMAGVASKAIWGEGSTAPGEEPVSGQKGKGTINEPYDKGNEQNLGAGGPVQSPGTTHQADGPSNATSSDVAGDATAGNRPPQKHQGADRPGDEPGPEDTKAIKAEKSESEHAQKDGKKTQMPHSDEEREKMMESGKFPHDPNDHSGEPLKMHDGGEKKDRSASVSQEGGNPHGKKHGTGEEYVKSTGMAAEGGDFDVTKPGAGREANRLMEEHGIHKTADEKPAVDDKASSKSGGSGASDKAGKPGKMSRLKEKLHLGTGKKLE